MRLNKFFLTFTFISAAAFAQEKDRGFAEHKSQMLKRMGEEKSLIEKSLGCVNAAQKQDDLKKCMDERRADMDKMHDQEREMKKKHLQDELKKLDEQGKKHGEHPQD